MVNLQTIYLRVESVGGPTQERKGATALEMDRELNYL